MSEAKHRIKLAVLKELRKEIFPYNLNCFDGDSFDLDSPKVKNVQLKAFFGLPYLVIIYMLIYE